MDGQSNWLVDPAINVAPSRPLVIVARSDEPLRRLLAFIPDRLHPATIGLVGSDSVFYNQSNQARMTAGDMRVAVKSSHFFQVLAQKLAGRVPAAIVTMSEQSQLLAAALREILEVYGMNCRQALFFRDKLLMKRRLMANGVPVPLFFDADHPEVPAHYSSEYLIKPRFSQGSRGIYTSSALQFPADLNWLDYMFEEYVRGEQYHVDLLFVGGSKAYSFVSRYLSPPLEFSVGRAGGSVVVEDPATYRRMSSFADRIIEAMPSVTTGSVHLDIFQTTDGRLLAGEIACRPAGNSIRGSLGFAYDINLVRSSLRAQAGLPVPSVDAIADRRRIVAWAEIRSREIQFVREPSFADAPFGVSGLQFHGEVGRKLAAPRDSGDNIVSFLVAGASVSEVLRDRTGAIAWVEAELERATRI